MTGRLIEPLTLILRGARSRSYPCRKRDAQSLSLTTPKELSSAPCGTGEILYGVMHACMEGMGDAKPTTPKSVLPEAVQRGMKWTYAA
jgi:hypothetical protein